MWFKRMDGVTLSLSPAVRVLSNQACVCQVYFLGVPICPQMASVAQAIKRDSAGHRT